MLLNERNCETKETAQSEAVIFRSGGVLAAVRFINGDRVPESRTIIEHLLPAPAADATT